MATPKRRGPKRKRGPKVRKVYGARVADINTSTRYGMVRDILRAARDLERRERELPTLTDPDDAAHAQRCIDAIRRTLPPFPVRTIGDAARGAAWAFAQRGVLVPTERARVDYFARRRAWAKRQGVATAANNSDAAHALEQALARVSAIRTARK